MFKTLVFDNLFDDEFHKVVTNELKHKARWIMSYDDVPEGYSDSGFVCYSWVKNANPNSIIDLPNLNAWAYLIFDKVASRSVNEISNPEIMRYVWNYYNSSSEGSTHIDHNEINFYSIVYNFTDCEGAGTYVGDEFFESKAGRAILFPSNTPHRGVGPKKDADQRFVLNIMIYNH